MFVCERGVSGIEREGRLLVTYNVREDNRGGHIGGKKQEALLAVRKMLL